jgi:short subunit dehydrogenase-like uncharacterized protein
VADTFLLYGANGYTGKLVAQRAVELGLRPVLAGRRRKPVRRLAERLGCESRAFSLDGGVVAKTLETLPDVRAVLNCAGPFAQTAPAMIDACLATGRHYLDITGEIDVIEAAARLSEPAKQRGVTLLPAVGFDVVPTDCLAAMLSARLSGATHLELAFAALGAMSRGTAKTVLETMPSGGRARIDGKIERVPAAWKAREIPFANGRLWAMSVPWGDVASAYYSTGIPNIVVYAAMPHRRIARIEKWRWAMPLFSLAPVKALARWQIDRQAAGPTDEERKQGKAQLWGRVHDADGHELSATLTTMEGYTLTAHTAVEAVRRVVAGEVATGFQTPSTAFGKEFILAMPQTSVEFIEANDDRSSVGGR